MQWKKRLRLVIYRAIGIILLPFLLLFLFYRLLKGKESWQGVLQRFGFTDVARGLRPQKDKRCIWIHGASLGETKATFILLQLLHDKLDLDKYQILLTCQTLSADKLLRDNADKYGYCHMFLPYDISIIADKFIAKWRPHLTIFMDSEIWPLYISINRSKQLLLNARLSAKSLKSWQLWPSFARDVIGRLDKICAATKHDANRYQQFNRYAERYNNLKFCAKAGVPKGARVQQLLEAKQQIGKPVIMFASTSAGETKEITKIVAALQNDYLIIVAPRHIKQAAVYYSLLTKSGVECQKSSVYPTPDKSVCISDKYGDYENLLGIADIVFVGGSLCNVRGGQNVLEPIKMGIPTITGCYAFNFKEVVEELQAHQALIVVKSYDELQQELQDTLHNHDKKQELTRGMQSFDQSCTGVAKKYRSVVLECL